MNLHELTATEIVRAIRAGETTCEAVTRACLERILEREPHVGAWHYLDPEAAVKQAQTLDRSGKQGPLQGVPIGMKDIIDTYDMPTEYGTPIHEGHRPHIDAAVVALSRRAGGVIMGKTVTTEFANRHPGKTRHPMDPARTPGGSSSGSGAAVGDRMVPLALGTQTTQSTIRPAAYCGCVGYRPTWGDIRCHGVMEAAGSLDTVGLIARSVEDIALYRDVLTATEPRPLSEAGVTAPVIGFARTHAWGECEPSTQKLLEECAAALARTGARMRDVTLPAEFEHIPDAHRWISSYEFALNRTWEVDHHYEMISETLRQNRLKDGLSCSFEKYRNARSFAERCRLKLDDILGEYDAFLTPATPGEAPVGLDATGSAAFGTLWTTLHVPSITLPLFTGPAGLPVGAQLVAKRNNDRQLLELARWVSSVYR
jgi:Asp-tRNA(Asn)/Glu-tRNA(Gln) amidotransferase A subunit family amidase